MNIIIPFFVFSIICICWLVAVFNSCETKENMVKVLVTMLLTLCIVFFVSRILKRIEKCQQLFIQQQDFKLNNDLHSAVVVKEIRKEFSC